MVNNIPPACGGRASVEAGSTANRGTPALAASTACTNVPTAVPTNNNGASPNVNAPSGTSANSVATVSSLEVAVAGTEQTHTIRGANPGGQALPRPAGEERDIVGPGRERQTRACLYGPRPR